MKIQIVGDGSFGSFLKRELPNYGFNVVDDAGSVILAVPISAYDEVGQKNSGKHLVNVCSVQKPSTDILLKHSVNVTSLHPLFGARTPADKRFSLLTYSVNNGDDTWFGSDDEEEFIMTFQLFSKILVNDWLGKPWTPKSHDIHMKRTHKVAADAAKIAKVLIANTDDIPDEYIPNSFRLLRGFVKTLDDMPTGTMESIMANPYI